MAATAPMRAKGKVITAINARSRSPTIVETSMPSISSTRLFAEHGRLAGLDDVLRPAHGMRGIGEPMHVAAYIRGLAKDFEKPTSFAGGF